MNDKLRKLAQQVHLIPDSRWPSVQTRNSIQKENRLEKFAELIILECTSVDLYWLSEQNRKAVAEKIKEHFGLEK